MQKGLKTFRWLKEANMSVEVGSRSSCRVESTGQSITMSKRSIATVICDPRYKIT